jgi:hypothetical protein
LHNRATKTFVYSPNGPYDHYAVNWGYRVIPNATTPEAEVSTLDKWILEKAGDKMFKYEENKVVVLIPTSQTEMENNNQ